MTADLTPEGIALDPEAAKGASQNTERELWYDPDASIFDPSRIFVTTGGGIGIQCGGLVVVKPLAEWHALEALNRRAQGGERGDTSKFLTGDRLFELLQGFTGLEFLAPVDRLDAPETLALIQEALYRRQAALTPAKGESETAWRSAPEDVATMPADDTPVEVEFRTASEIERARLARKAAPLTAETAQEPVLPELPKPAGWDYAHDANLGTAFYSGDQMQAYARAALKSRPTDTVSREAESWQPIATAPRDGTWLLICGDPQGGPERVVIGRNRNDIVTPDCFETNFGNWWPTHWRLIPAAPKATSHAR